MTAEVARASHIPLYIQIEEELRGQILAGEFGPLAQVPSEFELADRFGVSRMTARKAIDRLVGDGLLFRQPGKGTFVAPSKISHVPSQQLSFSAAMRALGLRHATRVLDLGMVASPSHVAQELGIQRGAPVIFVRRLRLVEDEPAAIHMSYLPVRFAKLLEEDLTTSLADLMSTLGGHIEQARDTIEAVAAAGEESQLLGLPTGSPLMLIQGTAYSAALEPLRYSEGLYRADRFRFGIDTRQPTSLTTELKRD